VCDNAEAWIAELYGRIERGDLTTLGLVHLEGWPIALEADLAAKILLADLEELEDSSVEEPMNTSIIARRSMLLDDLCQLRERIG
jgi:hypothetical protein